MTQALTAAEGTLGKLINQNLKQIESVLPRHLTPTRIARVAMMEARRNPQLLSCSPESFVGAVMQASQLGLEPGGVLGHAYLLPFRNKGRMEVQFVPGYKGLMDLARRSGMVETFDAQVVYRNDHFEQVRGTSPKLVHIPTMGDRGEPIAAYAVAGMANGQSQFSALSFSDIEEHRKASKAGNGGPWKTHWGPMACKTAIRALSTFLPMSNEYALAMEMDRKADMGESQVPEMKIQADFNVGQDSGVTSNAEHLSRALDGELEALTDKPGGDQSPPPGTSLFPNKEKPE